MNRRAFFGLIAGGLAAAADPERLLWVPGRKLISIPAPSFSPGSILILEQWWNRGRHWERLLFVGGEEVSREVWPSSLPPFVVVEHARAWKEIAAVALPAYSSPPVRIDHVRLSVEGELSLFNRFTVAT